MFSLTRRNVQGWMRGGSGCSVMASGAFVSLRVGCRERGRPKAKWHWPIKMPIIRTRDEEDYSSLPLLFLDLHLLRQFAHLRSRGVGYVVQALSNVVDIGAVQWCGVV